MDAWFQYVLDVKSWEWWKKIRIILDLDCWPSGRFCVGFIVPPEEQATIIFEFLSNFDATPVPYDQYRGHLWMVPFRGILALGSKSSDGLVWSKGWVWVMWFFVLTCHTLQKLGIFFGSSKDTKKSKCSASSNVPCCPLFYKSVYLHVDGTRWMTLHPEYKIIQSECLSVI